MRALGLDLNNNTLKGVLLRSGWTGWAVEAAGEVPLAGRSPAVALGDLTARLGAPPERTCVGLDRAAALFRTVELPFSDPAKVARAAPFAAEEVLPMGLDKVRVASLPPRPAPGGKFAVPILAVPRTHLDARRGVAPAGGRAPAVQLDSVGTAEALMTSPAKPARGEGVLLVDVGARKTTLDVLRDDGLAHSRVLRLGTSRMAAAAAPSLPGAAGDLEEAFRAAFTGGAAPPEEALRAVFKVYDDIAREAGQTLASVRREGTGVERMLVTGGGAAVRHLVPYLGERMGLPVKHLPLPSLDGKVPQPGRYAAALGLALVAAERGRLAVDFTPEDRRHSWDDPFAAGLLAFGLVLAGAVLTGRTWTQARAVEEAAAQARARADAALTAIGQDTAGALGPRIERLRQLLGAFETLGRSPLKVLDAVTEVVPTRGDVRFELVRLEGNKLRVEAVGEDVAAGQAFETALRAHPGFEDVNLEAQSGQYRGAGSSRFAITASVGAEAFR